MKNNDYNKSHYGYPNRENMNQQPVKQASSSGSNNNKLSNLQPNFKNKLGSLNHSTGVKHTETSLRRHYETNVFKNKTKNVKVDKWIGKKNEADISDDDWLPMKH